MTRRSVALFLALWTGRAAAQTPAESTLVAAPGPQYAAGGLHRFLLGDTHRDLWTIPLRVPLLDLARRAGGLTAFEQGGSKQSRSLRFRSADGRIFVFRVLDKDPTQTWPPLLRRTPARDLAEDQTSAIFPAGALTVRELERAAGLVTAPVELLALPDDPALGEWREAFRGELGLFEERVRGRGDDVRAVPGALEVLSTTRLFERLEAEARNRVDQRRFLAARLFDLLVGDWDRHQDQWSWARIDEGPVSRWEPLPRDRDWALSRLDGPLYALLRLYLPKYQSFDRRYGSVYGLTLSAEPLDRRLLTGLERPVWDSVAADLARRIDDAAIDRAVGALPDEYPASVRRRLTAALRSRRDGLPAIAAAFYRQLASAVDLWGSDEPEVARIRREADGGVAVTLEDRAGLRAVRRFAPDETGEVRLYLRGGPDSVVMTGPGRSGIKVRVIGGGGADAVVDSTGGARLRLYDAAATAVAGPGAVVKDRPWKPPVPTWSPEVIHRDWGHRWSVVPWFEVRPEVGLIAGGGPVLTRYSFRKWPYQSRIAFRMAYATGAGGLNADLDGDFRFVRPDLRLTLSAAALGTDVVRFFGFGNLTERRELAEYYDVRQRSYRIRSALEWRRGRGTISLGGFVAHSSTDLDDVSLLTATRPYGVGSFTEAGLETGVGFDSRDERVYPTRGVHAEVTGRLVPGLLDVDRSFGSIGARAAAYATAGGLPARPTLAVRAGATRVLGRYPFFEGAWIGGRSSVRGLNSRRFLGDAALFGGAEVRLDFGRYLLVVPGEWGLSGLVDAGRVYLDGETSDRWHSAVGAGLWFAFLDRRSTMTVTWATSEERSRLYVQAGFHF